MSKVSKEKLREVYDEMDTNDDGTVSYHELKNLVMRAMNCSDDEADGIVHVSAEFCPLFDFKCS